jgi:hypothetical protein
MGEPDKNSSEIARTGLSADEILALRDLQLNYPYNFAEPPYPAIHWQLFELIDHASFPFAKTDACDKWGCKEISPENFFYTLDRDRLGEPGFLSALTVGKLVCYCLLIAESTSESFHTVAEGVELRGDTLLERIRLNAEHLSPGIEEYSPWRQFFAAVRHPIVRWAVNNAMMNRWGAELYPVPSSPAGFAIEERIGFGDKERPVRKGG